jgi:hypothetical protein
MQALALIAALADPAAADGALTLDGRVEAVHARSAGDTFITEADVRLPDGTLATVIQLGGLVDGVREWYSHQPAPLAPGDRVVLDVVAGRTTAWRAQLTVSGQHPLDTPAGPQVARYGVVHTKAGTPVWRDTGCLAVAYGRSVSEPYDAAFDAAFETWTTATSCGALAFDRMAARPDQAAADGVSSVHVLSSRWCRPATATEPELCYPHEATGMTRLRFVDDVFADDDGRIIEADIELNAVDYTLATVVPQRPPPTSDKPVIDLASLATHEVGHLLGLSHSCAVPDEPWPADHAGAPVPRCDQLAADAPAVAATMYYKLAPGDTGQQTLEDGDALAVCEISRSLTCERLVVGGCAASDPRPASPLPVGIALAILLTLGGSRRSPASQGRGKAKRNGAAGFGDREGR